MQTQLISHPPAKPQDACAQPASRNTILIFGQYEGELHEPRNFILQAARTVKTGKAIGRKHSVTALKAIGLMTAAAFRAKNIGRWSTKPGYDPYPDLMALHELATARLGPVRESSHPVTQFRDVVAHTIRILGEPVS